MSASTWDAQGVRGEIVAGFGGDLIRSEHPEYDVHRAVWNGAIDRLPALIARCRDVDDVVAIIRLARETGMELAVRSGGHSFPGLSTVDGGIVLDTSLMKRIDVDPAAHIARVQAGVLLGEMDAATQEHGLAVPTGAVTHTGVAGLTLGGGIGWLMRKHGLAVDSLRSAELATADGRVLRVSPRDHPELFWGIRGGGGNFGVVTEFEFDLHEIGPTVVSGLVLWPMEDAESVSAFYRDWCRDAPPELTTALVLRKAPTIELVPSSMRGRPVVGVLGCWAGPLDEGERFWEPLRSFGHPAADLTARRAFVDHQSMMDGSFPHGLHVYMKACDVPELSDEVLHTSIDHARQMISDRSSFIAWQMGGAVAAVDDDATAFSSRRAGFIINVTGISHDAGELEPERRWVRAFWEALSPHETGVYVNFLNDASSDRVRAAYGAERFERLQELKRTYDPDNLFHLNQNIPPA